MNKNNYYNNHVKINKCFALLWCREAEFGRLINNHWDNGESALQCIMHGLRLGN